MNLRQRIINSVKSLEEKEIKPTVLSISININVPRITVYESIMAMLSDSQIEESGTTGGRNSATIYTLPKGRNILPKNFKQYKTWVRSCKTNFRWYAEICYHGQKN